MKVSHSQLLEIVRKLVKEALKEAGPVGYLSKTNRPDMKTGWNPEAQKQWVAGQSDPSSPGKPLPTSQPAGSAAAATGTASTNVNSPPTNLGPQTGTGMAPPGAEDPDLKTNAGVPSAKSGMKPVTPAPVQNSLADVSAQLQGASQEQIAQIMAILKGS